MINFREHLPLIVIACLLAGGLLYVWRDLQATKAQVPQGRPEVRAAVDVRRTGPPAPAATPAQTTQSDDDDSDTDDDDETDGDDQEFEFPVIETMDVNEADLDAMTKEDVGRESHGH